MAYVCNLYFNEQATFITKASAPSASDGSVNVECYPTDETPKFSISSASSPTDPPYSTRTNLTGYFGGLGAGTYIINVRTNDFCKRELTIVIEYVVSWNPRYRLKHETVTPNSKLSTIFDIEQRDYEGSVSYPEAGQNPIELTWRNEGGSTVFEPVIGSQLIVTLNSTYRGQFDDLITYDERKYRGTLYVNGVQKWQGYAIPMNNDQPYTMASNYDFVMCFVDGLEKLSALEFTDDSGNHILSRISFFSAIGFILRKTGLPIDTWETINFYANGMSTGGNNSTLKQLYFDPTVYLQSDGTMEDCKTVLQSLLKNLGARLIQSDGVWCIDGPTQKTGSTTTTRKTAYTGSQSNSSESYRLRLRANRELAPRLTFMEGQGSQGNQVMYGRLAFTFDYGIEDDPNMLLEGKFIDEDIENGQLKGWQFDYSNDSAAFYGYIPKIINVGDRKGVLEIPWDTHNGISGQEVIVMNAAPIAVNITTRTKFILSFDVYTSVLDKETYQFLDIAVEINGTTNYLMFPTPATEDGAYHINEKGLLAVRQDQYVNDGEWIYTRVHITNHNEWKTLSFDIVVDPDEIGSSVVGELQVKIRPASNRLYDFENTVDLAADPTTYARKTHYNRARILDPTGDSVVHYIMQESISPDTDDITPDDYGTAIWKFEKKVLIPPYNGPYQSWGTFIRMDNARLQYLPDGQDPEASETVEVVMNEFVSNKLEETFRHGDLPSSDPNYKNIMRGWLSLSDGTPTSTWRYIGGPIPHGPRPTLMQLLREMYQGQYMVDRWKLSGTVDCVEGFPFIGRPVYETSTGRIYVPTYSSVRTRDGAADIQMIEALKGVPSYDPNPDPDVEPPISLREHSDEFTSEFA